MNTFYCRFDCHDFETERKCDVQYANLLPEHTSEISRDDAASVFKNVKVNRAAGSDKITGKLLNPLDPTRPKASGSLLPRAPESVRW